MPMKIKTVCEMTGLTDRTVRYYIEEQLISPDYTENYVGRKTFCFSHGDIAELQNIAVLRKFGFTVSEIREMLTDPHKILPLTKALQKRKETAIAEETALLYALERIEETAPETVADLAAELSAPVQAGPLPQEDTAFRLGGFLKRFFRSFTLALLIWLPVLVSFLGIVLGLRWDEYPVFSPRALVLIAIFLTPSLLLALLSKFKSRFSVARILVRTAEILLCVLCVLSIPFSFIASTGISSRSETTNIYNYRRFDADCLANRYDFFQDLFPTWPHTFIRDNNLNDVYLDVKYLYRYLPAMDYTYDIYAEWPLEQEAFDAEVQRVTELFETRESYETVKRGNYTCLFSYYGAPPFEPVTDSYTYYIFAYDEENLYVRYILCDSLENGVDQPYYLSLDWE